METIWHNDGIEGDYLPKANYQVNKALVKEIHSSDGRRQPGIWHSAKLGFRKEWAV